MPGHRTQGIAGPRAARQVHICKSANQILIFPYSGCPVKAGRPAPPDAELPDDLLSALPGISQRRKIEVAVAGLVLEPVSHALLPLHGLLAAVSEISLGENLPG